MEIAEENAELLADGEIETLLGNITELLPTEYEYEALE